MQIYSTASALLGRVKQGSWLTISLCMLGQQALAFNSPTHEQMIRSAFTYLKSMPKEEIEKHPATAQWLLGPDIDNILLEELLVRGAVDADYYPDLWIDGIVQAPFAGGKTKDHLVIFTTMYHFVNVTVQGNFWDDDGYAYRHGSKEGNDALLGTFSAAIQGKLARPLGGTNNDYPEHGIPIGQYNIGFKGSNTDWTDLFFNSSASDAVFPPSYVPAQLALESILKSDRVEYTKAETWNETLPLVTGFFSRTNLTRHYWRAEIKGLPRAIDRLGLILHLAQDLALPHHTLGTASYCHPELESFIDREACNSTQPISIDPFDNGIFGGNFGLCQTLYDRAMVEKFLNEFRGFTYNEKLTITDRFKMLATLSSKWQWSNQTSDVDEYIFSRLPDGTVFKAKSCSQIFTKEQVKAQVKYQYNLGVAATVAFFELTATSYENAHPKLSNWINLILPFVPR